MKEDTTVGVLPVRIKWLFAGAFALGPAVLFGVMTAINARQIKLWLDTGMCPGGPMDRLPAACGPLELFSITILGGWVAWLVVLVLAAWWIVCILVLLVTLAVRARGGS